ncbi:nitrous oxide reductase family maturation protein NosD, partial [Haloferax sp. Atlit-4N]
VIVAAGVGVATAPTHAQTDSPVDFEQPVPDEYSFEGPSESGSATVGGETYTSLQTAVDAAEPGDQIRLDGEFDERVVVNTSNVTLVGTPGRTARIDGNGTGDVLTLNGDDITLRRVWVYNGGYDTSGNDAGIWVNGTNTTIRDSRVTKTTFGI